jgi:hypothetical protein
VPPPEIPRPSDDLRIPTPFLYWRWLLPFCEGSFFVRLDAAGSSLYIDRVFPLSRQLSKNSCCNPETDINSSWIELVLLAEILVYLSVSSSKTNKRTERAPGLEPESNRRSSAYIIKIMSYSSRSVDAVQPPPSRRNSTSILDTAMQIFFKSKGKKIKRFIPKETSSPNRTDNLLHKSS